MRLREEGANVVIIGLSRKAILGYHGLEITPEISIDEVEDANTFAGLIIPGGFAPDFLRRNQKLLQLESVSDSISKPAQGLEKAVH